MNTLPSLRISSALRLKQFVSQRLSVRSDRFLRKPRLRLTVAGMLPAMKHLGIVRAGLDPLDIPQRQPSHVNSELKPAQQPTKDESITRSPPTRTSELFRSLLNGAVMPAQKSATTHSASSADLSTPRQKNLTPPSPHLQRLVDRAARAPSQSLPAGLRDFLGGRLKKWLPSVQIHQGPAADELTSVMQADAVTFGNKIAFRHRRYQPDRPEGLALLGHELAHVAQAAATSPAMSPAADERAALIHEHQIFHELSRPRAQQRRIMPSTMTTPTPHAEAGPIRTAHEGRTLPTIASSEPDPVSERQLADLKDQVYRDLLQRLRTDFERGS